MAGRVVGQPLIVRRLWPRIDARTLVPLLCLLAVGLLVLAPLVIMVIASLRPIGVMPLDAGVFTLDNYADLTAKQNATGEVLLNTLLYTGGTLLLATPLAFGLAFLTERTDVPARKLLYTLMFVPMVTPAFATALGWVLLAGPRAGTINEYVRLIIGSDSRQGPFNIYTLWGMIFVSGLGIVPSMWLLLVSVLRNMDPNLEDAGSASGVSRLGTLRHVTLPLMLPGVLAVIIYFGVVIVDSFEIPLALGITAGVPVLGTKIYLILTGVALDSFNYGAAAAFGMMGVVLGVAGISLYLWLTRRAARYSVVTGKAYRPRLIKLGRWKYVALGMVAFYMTIKVVLPFTLLIYASFLRFYVAPIPENWGDLPWTLDNYRRLFDYRFFGRPLVTTGIVVIISATTTMLLAAIVSWSTVRLPSALSKLVDVLTFVPLAIPGVIITLSVFLLFIGTPVYGTLVLFVIAFMIRYLAYSARLMHAAQLQISKELEEVSLASGVGGLTTFFHINVRLLLPALANGWLWIVTHAARDFTTPLMLTTGSTLLVANVIYGKFVGGRFTESAAAIVALVVLMMALVFAGRKWVGAGMAR